MWISILKSNSIKILLISIILIKYVNCFNQFRY
uniref:Uncharacterized protein n=1 Tax=Phyllymenia taiwanensis TaxID=1260292 RepID=R9XXT3_9FLOR|nr:hypothetical protein [Grateloupia taiwanensis]AGO19789.1 hypothetical protein [Grateloupia taiwanensis]